MLGNIAHESNQNKTIVAPACNHICGPRISCRQPFGFLEASGYQNKQIVFFVEACFFVADRYFRGNRQLYFALRSCTSMCTKLMRVLRCHALVRLTCTTSSRKRTLI